MSSLPTQPEDPREWKIFPRNLTARADYIVPGNPVPTRPEDGVDNCYPGLEMDAKNIQKNFFPGLYFEVYRDDGARLAGLTPLALDTDSEASKIKKADVDNEVYIWVMRGRNNKLDGSVQTTTFDLTGKQGLYVWRQINSLLLDKVSIGIGPGVAKPGKDFDAALKIVNKQGNHVERDSKGTLLWAVLTAPRVDYLNKQGVLEPEIYDPGDLTRTLCTPWTYDFRDCQCFYWASNKPDVVSSEDGQYEYLNFQRKSRDIEPQTQDIAYGYNARRQQEINYAEMMEDWEQLRPVVNGREFGETYVPPDGPKGPLLSLKQIKDEMSYLATVEHALAVQYLYAFYSLDVPWTEPNKADVRDFRVWNSARTVFDIAIDEMRHFRWANEVLKLLNYDTTTKRASMLGRNLKVPFYLQSLSSPQLQWFIDVERPSRSTVVGLDGMYVGILRSLQHLSDTELDPDKRQKAIEIVKLIADEGEGHYVRFSTAQQNFAYYDDAGRGELPSYVLQGQWSKKSPNTDPSIPYSSLFGVPKKASNATGLKMQAESDGYYHLLLMLLKIAFAIPNTEVSGWALRRAISVMFRMNATNIELAQKGLTPMFNLPEGWDQDPPIKTRADAMAMLDRASKFIPAKSQRMMETLSIKAPAFTSDPAHNLPIEDVFSAFEEAIDKADFPR